MGFHGSPLPAVLLAAVATAVGGLDAGNFGDEHTTLVAVFARDAFESISTVSGALSPCNIYFFGTGGTDSFYVLHNGFLRHVGCRRNACTYSIFGGARFCEMSTFEKGDSR